MSMNLHTFTYIKSYLETNFKRWSKKHLPRYKGVCKIRKSNRVAEMRETGIIADAKTAPNLFIPHVAATVDIACPITPYNIRSIYGN